MVTVGSYDTPTHASLARMRLEQEGIVCVLVNEQYNSVMRGLAAGSVGWGGVWLQVRAEDGERAAQLLKDSTSVPDDWQERELEVQAEAATKCPRCLSEGVEYHEAPEGLVGTCAACGHRWELS
jgi:hypothetical protein